MNTKGLHVRVNNTENFSEEGGESDETLIGGGFGFQEVFWRCWLRVRWVNWDCSGVRGRLG